MKNDMINKISFDKVCFGYKKNLPVFKDLTFTIKKTQKKGRIVGLMGDSGSGKSTLFKLLLGTEKLWSGNINIFSNSPIISYVPQEPVLFEHLSPMENAHYFSKTIRYNDSFKEERFIEMVATLGMKKTLETAKSVNEISGGQKQSIALIRALSIQPDILLLDEPLTGLDEKIKDSFLTTIALLADKYNLLVLYITHHRREVELIADEIIYLIKEEYVPVSEVGQYPTTDFFNIPPTISSLYLSKELDTNIIKILIDSKDNLLLCGNTRSDSLFHICVASKNISFQSNGGWEYMICAETDKYCFVRLKDHQSTILTLPISMRDSMGGMNYLVLNGMINFYQYGKFSETKKIINNKIIS